MTEVQGTDRQKAEGDAFEYAWRWFQYHATQRMTILQFYFAATAFLLVGYYYTIDSSRADIALGFAVTFVILTLLFRRLDARTMELIKLGEVVLKQWEARISVESQFTINLVQQADSKASPFVARMPHHVYSYRQITRLIFALFLVVGCSAAIYAGWYAAHPPMQSHSEQSSPATVKDSSQ